MIDALAVLSFLALAVALVVLLVKRVTGGSALVLVQEDVRVGGRAQDFDATLAARLAKVRGARVRVLGPGHYVVTVTRSPNWTLWFLPLFGLGFLLSLLFLKQWHLGVSLYDAADGAWVRLDGWAEQRVLERVRSMVTSP